MLRGMGSKVNEVSEERGERGMNNVFVSVWLGPLYIKPSI